MFYRYNLENGLQFYSVFPPNYIKPIYKKDEQEALYQEETELKQFSLSPIKPAKTNNTCSEFHDELVR